MRLDASYKNVTISEGTTLTQDLIPKIINFLQSHKVEIALMPEIRKALRDDLTPQQNEKALDDLNSWYETDEAYFYLYDYLFDKMDEISPENCYFGSHPGDGCDYGFWEEWDEFE